MRVTSQRTRQALLVTDAVIDPEEQPERLALFDQYGDPIALSAAAGVPVGGLFGQVLAKAGDDDYNLEWIELPSGALLPVGGTTGQVLAKDSDVDGDASWVTPPPSSDVNSLHYKGDWNAITAYEVNDVVKDGGSLYVNITAAAAGATRPENETGLSDTTTGPGGVISTTSTCFRIYPSTGKPAVPHIDAADYFFDLSAGGNVTIVMPDTTGDYIQVFNAAGIAVASNFPSGSFGSSLTFAAAAGRYFVRLSDAFAGAGYINNPLVTLSAGATFSLAADKWSRLVKSSPTLTEAIYALAPKSWYKLGEDTGNYINNGSIGPAGTPVSAGFRGVTPGAEGEPCVRTVDDASSGTAVATFGDFHAYPNVSPFTILLFHRPTVIGTNTRRLLIKNDSTAGPFIGLSPTGKYVALRAGAPGAVSASSAQVPMLGEWQMLVMRYDGTNLHLFHNNKKTSGTAGGNMPNASGVNLRLHGEPGNNVDWGANGAYQHLAIWDSALTDIQIASIWNAFRDRR